MRNAGIGASGFRRCRPHGAAGRYFPTQYRFLFVRSNRINPGWGPVSAQREACGLDRDIGVERKSLCAFTAPIRAWCHP